MSTLALRRAVWLPVAAVLLALTVILGAPAKAQQHSPHPPGVTKPAGAASAQQPPGTASPARPASVGNPAPSSPPANAQLSAGNGSGAETEKEKQTVNPDSVRNSRIKGVVRSPNEFVAVLVYVGLLFALLMVLHVVDSFHAYRFSKQTRDEVIGKLDEKVPVDDVVRLTNELAKLGEPTGIPGTTRSIFTYALAITLGISVFHLLAFSQDPEAGKYADKILMVLAGSLSSIIGFYFGSKATKEGAESAKAQQAAEPAEPPGEITRVTPKQAKVGDQVTIEGTGFGNQKGTVTFGTIPADKVEDWKENSIIVNVPKGAQPGSTAIRVNPTGNREIIASPTLFEVTT